MASRGRGRGGRGLANKNICVGEDFKISVNAAIKEFRYDESQRELEFPPSFTSTERAYVHRLAQSMGLNSKSKGKGINRFLNLYKKDTTKLGSVAVFSMSPASCSESYTMLQRFPVTGKERQDLQLRLERRRYTGPGSQPRETPKTTGRLNNGIPQAPGKRSASDLEDFRKTLPVYDMQHDIMTAIAASRVILLCGETGSGKTTQVPQFILDECHQAGRPCRIICTQPRRLSALSVAERVAAERGESIGQTVGYQIRLESRVSPKTVLTFCTNGVLLRTLMSGEHALSTISHVIVDEIHERDRFSDFLLIQLRDLLRTKPHLKLILMSAALDTELFIRYFNGCPIVNVPGKLFDVEELFLEDALKCTGYSNKKMVEYKQEKAKVVKQQVQLDQWLKNETSELDGAKSSDANVIDQLSQATAHMGVSGASARSVLDNSMDVQDMPDWLLRDMDSTLTKCWLTGSDEAFTQLIHMVLSENVSVDYAHSETSATPLTVAVARGKLEVTERLLSLGANVNGRMSNDMTALDIAKKFNQKEVVELLEAYIAQTQSKPLDDADLVKHSAETSEEDKDLLQAYHHSFDDERVDLDLVVALLTYICDNSQEGAVLVFLPGYDDIVKLRDKLLNDDQRFCDGNMYRIYTLHSAMQSSDQKKVFQHPAKGTRKIILSTNIAETSVTINDVVFVIDSGKVKEKTFDALSSISMLKSTWISKASAKQRKGRAGRCRPGMCFHMMSRIRYKSLPQFQTPEILRVPLQELCLHTKLLSLPDTPIADYLAKAPEAPATLVVKNAVSLLKAIDCMDQWEDLTELGHHLADLPVEPRLGKMVLYSIVLKCLDPVLTIVCALAYRDPFILPNHPSEKRISLSVRKKYAANTFSDHMALLRAFQAWQRARSDGWEKSFCERNFLSRATLEMIVGMRTQLLGQLRASGFVRARGPGDIRDLNTNSENWAVVKASLCAGTYPYVIKVDRNRNQLTTQTENKVRFHPNSVMHENATSKLTVGENHFQTVQSLPTDWLIYEEMTRTNHHTSVRCATIVTPITVALFAGPSRLPHDALKQPEINTPAAPRDNDSSSEEEEEEQGQRATLKLDEWLALKAEPAVASLALQLRQKWHTLFLRRMRTPAKPWSQADEVVLTAILKVLSNEEQAVGLQQPVGVGQRPRPVAVEHFNSPPRSNIAGRFGQQQNHQQNTQYSNNSRMNGQYHHQGGNSGSTNSSPGTQNKPWASPKRTNQQHQQYPQQPTNRSPSGGWTAAGKRSSPGRMAANFSQAGRGGGGAGKMHHGGYGQMGMSQGGSQDSQGKTAESSRFFILKCSDSRNIDMSYHKGVWCTTPGNEKILSQAFKTVSLVYLVITLQGSGQFQGYAQMTSDICYPRSAEWRDNSGRLGGEFSVQWIKKANVSFHQTRHLLNPWNGNQRIQASRDGQELEPSVGEKVTQLWFRAPTCPINGAGGDTGLNYPLAPAPVSYWDRSSNVTPPPTIPKVDKLDSPTGIQWPPDGPLQPLAHSTPAIMQGPGAMFSQQQQQQQQQQQANSTAAPSTYGPAGAMYFPGGGDSGQVISSMSSRQWSGGYEAATHTKDPW